jgi:hypothetical protein
VNDISRDGENDVLSGDADRWTLGPDLRHKGSIHSDRCSGSAAELAERENIGSSGDWLVEGVRRLAPVELRGLLFAHPSMRVPELDVDSYIPVANSVQVPVTVEICPRVLRLVTGVGHTFRLDLDACVDPRASGGNLHPARPPSRCDRGRLTTDVRVEEEHRARIP